MAHDQSPPPPRTRQTELGWLTDETPGRECLAFGDLTGMPCRITAGRTHLSLGVKGEAPIRLDAAKARALAAALQRWAVSKTLAAA